MRAAACHPRLAHQRLALDLDADQQEEHGHEAVVDPVQHGLRERQRRDAHRERPQQEIRVFIAQRRIRENQGQRHGHHQREGRERIALVSARRGHGRAW
jgi:hypothetical protein